MGSSTPPSNTALLRESLAEPILRKAALITTDPATTSDADDLSDFIDYLSTELFTSLPAELQSLTSISTPTTNFNIDRYARDALCPSVCIDSLVSYGYSADSDLAEKLLSDVVAEYISAATAPPPVWKWTRTAECEICERDSVRLSYHHLIPRSMHSKALKRAWHPKERLNSVAWLCGACHNTVHRCASNEELAKEWYTVERLMEREDMRRWARYVGGQKGKGGTKNAPMKE